MRSGRRPAPTPHSSSILWPPAWRRRRWRARCIRASRSARCAGMAIACHARRRTHWRVLWKDGGGGAAARGAFQRRQHQIYPRLLRGILPPRQRHPVAARWPGLIPARSPRAERRMREAHPSAARPPPAGPRLHLSHLAQLRASRPIPAHSPYPRQRLTRAKRRLRSPYQT